MPSIYADKSIARTSPSYPASSEWPWLSNYLGLVGPSARTGVNVDEWTAQNVSTVYACITLIAQTLASLPIGCFRKSKENSREVADQHPSHWLFNKSPDDIMTSFMYRETQQGHVLLRGNAYSEIVRNNRGQAVELHLLDPRKISVEIEDNGNYQYPIYRYNQPVGKPLVFDRSEVLHIANWTSNGLVGLPPLTLFRESLGLTIAANQYAAEYFRKGGHPLGFLTKPTMVQDKEREQVRADWKEFHGGTYNSHQVGLLGGGWDWKSIGLSNQDAQLLGLRQFQKYEIAELFRVPPFLLGDVEQPVSNIEFMLIQYLIFTLLPWMKRHEGEYNMKCFTKMERFNYYLEYNADGILRGDAKSRNDAFSVMAKHGALLIDEWREYQNLPKLPDGLGSFPLIMASQFAKLEDVRSGKANLDTTGTKKKSQKKAEEDKVNRLASYYSKLDEHDRDRLKGLIVSMNGSKTYIP